MEVGRIRQNMKKKKNIKILKKRVKRALATFEKLTMRCIKPHFFCFFYPLQLFHTFSLQVSVWFDYYNLFISKFSCVTFLSIIFVTRKSPKVFGECVKCTVCNASLSGKRFYVLCIQSSNIFLPMILSDISRLVSFLSSLVHQIVFIVVYFM